MKIAHLNSAYDGGTGEAARRLHRELLRRGCDSTFFNFQKSVPEERAVRLPSRAVFPFRLAAKARAFLIERERAAVRRRLDPDFDGFSDDRTSLMPDVGRRLAGYDLVHIHGTSYLVDYGRTLAAFARRGQRVVWTLHDMNAFTGGCHYDRGCGGFLRQCGRCPALGSRREDDVSRAVWRRKEKGLRALRPARTALVCPSRWLAGLARESTLLSRFPVSVIPNGLDAPPPGAAPPDRAAARLRLELPPEARIVLLVASSLEVRRKGFHLLEEALRRLSGLPGLYLAAAGALGRPLGVDLPHRLFGPVSDPGAMRDLYAAADLLAVPSLQDNLPNTVLEAMNAGLPVVAFDSGGIPEMVREGATGFTVPVGDSAALADRIGALLGDGAARAAFGSAARRIAAAEYGSALQADRYLQLYETLRAA